MCRFSAAMTKPDNSTLMPTFPPLPLMLSRSGTHVTATSNMREQKFAITCVGRGRVGDGFANHCDENGQYVDEIVLSCCEIVAQMDSNHSTCCSDVVRNNWTGLYSTLGVGRLLSTPHLPHVSVFCGHDKTLQIHFDADFPSTSTDAQQIWDSRNNHQQHERAEICNYMRRKGSSW